MCCVNKYNCTKTSHVHGAILVNIASQYIQVSVMHTKKGNPTKMSYPERRRRSTQTSSWKLSSSLLLLTLCILLGLICTWPIAVDAFTIVCGGSVVGTDIASRLYKHSNHYQFLQTHGSSKIHASSNDDETAETITMDLDPYGTPQELCEALGEGQLSVVDQLRGELRRIGLRDDDIVAGDDEALELAKRLFITKYLPMEDVPEKYLSSNLPSTSSSLTSSETRDDGGVELGAGAVIGSAEEDDSTAINPIDTSGDTTTGTASESEPEEDIEIEMLENVAAEIKRLEEALIAKIEEEEENGEAEVEKEGEDVTSGSSHVPTFADQAGMESSSATVVGNISAQDGTGIVEGSEGELVLGEAPSQAVDSETAKLISEADSIEAEKKAYMERMLEVKRLAELAEDDNAVAATSTNEDDKITAEEERLEAELLSLEVQLEAERQRLDQVRLEVEHLSLVDEDEKAKNGAAKEEEKFLPAAGLETKQSLSPQTEESNDPENVRARIASSYNRYSRLDQQGAINKPNNARKEEVEHRLESQKRAVQRLAELNSPEYQRLSQRYNRYARLDDVTARLNELVAAKEDRNAGGHQAKQSENVPTITAATGAESGDGNGNAQKQKEQEEQKNQPPQAVVSTGSAPRRAGPGLVSTTESFREQRQWKKKEIDDLTELDGGWEKLDINWRVSARQFFGNDKRRLDSLGASAFEHRFVLQLHLLDESKVECELRVVDVNADIVIRNAKIFVYCADESGNRVEAHALEIENDGKEKTLFASDSDTDVGSVSYGRCPFTTTPSDGGARAEVSRQMLLQQAMESGLRVHASFDVNTVEQVTSRIFSV